MKWLLERLTEPSSHAGIAAALQAAKLFLPPPWSAVLDAATGLFAALAFAVKEKQPA